MTIVTEQECPLCHSNAQFISLDHGNMKHFKCTNCHEFVISKDAERDLINRVPLVRAQLSEKAKLAEDGYIFSITTTKLELKREGFGHPSFNEEFVERKTLNLYSQFGSLTFPPVLYKTGR